jgi:hypothetical protein
MMPYDDFSARVFERTNWRALGAVYRPPARLRQWGAPLNDAERQALGVARLAAASARDGQGTAEFQQEHPKESRATLNCVAWTSSAGGWKIDLIDTRGGARNVGAEGRPRCSADLRLPLRLGARVSRGRLGAGRLSAASGAASPYADAGACPGAFTGASPSHCNYPERPLAGADHELG